MHERPVTHNPVTRGTIAGTTRQFEKGREQAAGMQMPSYVRRVSDENVVGIVPVKALFCRLNVLQTMHNHLSEGAHG